MKKQGADVIGAKAGAKPKKPYIQKDTIGSTQNAEIVYGIGDGENGGLINGLNSIILDGTRVIGSSGEVNFNEVKYEERFGLIDQPPLKLIEDTITERGLNLEVRSAAPVVSSFNNKDVDKFVVRISVPSLMQNKDNGDSVAATISYAIDISVDGGAYQTVLEASATEKITNGYEFDHEIEAPEGTQRTIRVRRTTPDSTSQLLIDKFYVAAISEVINAKFSHPTLHYIGLVFNAEQFNNIPKAVFHYYGRKIKVPVNYNPTTRQYDGIWNGTFKVVYSNNPAWVLFDILTDRRSGLGRRIPVELVDKWELYRIAQYCDELVPDGEGGMEPRFVCNNLVLNSKQDSYQVLKDIASIFRGQSFWNGSQVVTVADAPRDIDYAISMASVISYSYSGTARNARHNVVKVQYYDKNNENSAAYEYATDYDSIRETEQINEVEIRAFGCTSAGQAQRLARYTLLSEQTETRILTAKLSMDAFVNMQIGDVFAWSDKFLAGANNGGRVVAVNGAELTLDRDVTESALVGDTLFVNTTSGKANTRTITAINGNKVTLDAVMSTTEPEFVWVIDSAELSLLYFKLDDYKVNPAEGTVDIVGIQHVNGKFGTIDTETALEAPPFSKVEIETLRAPGNVITSFNVRVDQGLNIADLYVSWGQVKGATRYTVEFRRDSQAWRVLGNVTGLTHTIENVSAGIYEVRVRAADSIGNLSPYGFSAPINVAGIVLPPPKLASFSAVGKLLAIETRWAFPAGTEASLAVVIEHATQDPANVGVPTQKLNIPYPQTEYVFNGLGARTQMWFRAAIVDKYNQEGEFTAWTTATADANPEELIGLISGHISESTLDQILKGKIDGALGLADEANSLASQANAAASNAQNAANQASTKAQEAANAVVQEAIDRAAAIQDGITQVTTDYRAGDAVVLGELVAYKTSNDSAMATVVQKAESAVAAGSTNSQAITELTGQVQAINNTKLDASVISNYYTKGQADEKSAEIAAGKIESYDANLVIGGTNLFSIADSVVAYTSPSDGSIVSSSEAHLSMQSLIPIGIHKQLVYQVWNPSLITNIDNYNRVVFFKADSSFLSLFEVPRLNGTPYQKALITVPDTAAYVRLAAIVGPYNAARDMNLKVKFEFGNKPTDWTPSDGDVQSSLNTNANAIQTINAEVARVNGELFATAESVSNLRSNVGLLQGSINEVRQTVTNNQESTNTLVTSLRSGMADADDVSMMMRNATVLHEDLSFKNGWNGVQVYNNHDNGALVANFTDKLPDNPVASTRQLQFIHSGGATTPALGGFHQAVQSRANGVFLVKFVAKLPVGFSFGLGANAYGDGANGYFIGGSEGTGKFKTYYAVYRCGATGYFSTVGFVYVQGSHPTPENPLIWHLASSTVYDCLDSKIAPDSVVNGIAEAKSTASTAVNKAEATAQIAQNLQADLDNTNAKLSTDYYTKSSTDQAIASATNQLSAGFDTAIKNVGAIRDTRYDNQAPSWYWANYPLKVEKEFKLSANLGIPQATVDTLGILETAVPWYDPSGGPIQQRFTWQDSAYALTRYSISDSAWSGWASALNEVKKTVDRKLDASIISNYYTKAEADNVVAGKLDKFSSRVLVSNENLFKADIIDMPKRYTQGISGFNWTNYWVIDIAAGNHDSLFIDVGSTLPPNVINANGAYAGAVTVSFDYMVEQGDVNMLPWLYFGYANQPMHHTVDGPYQFNKWYRIYTTYYTNSETLLRDLRLGVSHMQGRVCVKNLKIERGDLTQYSADIKETTKSINGIEAVKTVTIDNNGVISGYGLISELKNGQVTSSFGVNADTFFIGSPSLDKKPFVQKNDWSLINGVRVPPGTYIDTAYIGAATIGTAHINDLAVTTAKIGEGQITTAKIGDLQVDTIKIKDNAVTSLLEVQRTQQRVEQNFPYIPANTLTSIKIKVVLMSGLSKNNRYLVYWRGIIGAGMSSRLSNTPPYYGWGRKRVYFGSSSSTDIVGSRILVETNQLNGNYIRWYENNPASTGNATQWNVAEGIVDETGSLCLWVDIEWKTFQDNIPADTLYGYLYMSELSVLISEFKK